VSQFTVRVGDASHLARYRDAQRDHERVEEHHEQYETHAERPFDQVEDEVPFVVRLAGHQEIHVVRVEVVAAGRPVAIRDLDVLADDDERQQRPHQQHEMTAGGEPARERGRHAATLPEEAGRTRIRGGAGHEVEARHVQTPADVVRVPDDRVRLEAPEREVADYDQLDDALGHVVGPVVEPERDQGQADRRERDHDHHGHSKHVAAADRGALRVDDVVQPGALGHQRAHDAVLLVSGRIWHVSTVTILSYRTNIIIAIIITTTRKTNIKIFRIFFSPKYYHTRASRA